MDLFPTFFPSYILQLCLFSVKHLGFCLVSSHPVKVTNRSRWSFLFCLVKQPAYELWAGFGKSSPPFWSVVVCDPLTEIRPGLTCKTQMKESPVELPADQRRIKGE